MAMENPPYMDVFSIKTPFIEDVQVPCLMM
jgi:hypothetical protein